MIFNDSMKSWSIWSSVKQNQWQNLFSQLERIEPDVSKQYSQGEGKGFDSSFYQLKIRAQHSFQIHLLQKAVLNLKKPKVKVVDIGDSSGAHMHYLIETLKTQVEIDSLSVNLDPVAIEKIKKRGFRALLSRAESLSLDEKVDIFTFFETLEHLHDPSSFLHRLAIRPDNSLLVVTVPYVRQSRVGLQRVRYQRQEKVTAEQEHIFELSPEDWKLLFLHSGWAPVFEQTYLQYPRRIPGVTPVLEYLWKRTDFEGFWGCVFKKDLTYANLYQDWGD